MHLLRNSSPRAKPSRLRKVVPAAGLRKAITDVPGSSEVYGYGVVSYANGAKESILGVKNQTLEDHGSVSAEVVTEMSKGAVRLSGADISRCGQWCCRTNRWHQGKTGGHGLVRLGYARRYQSAG